MRKTAASVLTLALALTAAGPAPSAFAQVRARAAGVPVVPVSPAAAFAPLSAPALPAAFSAPSVLPTLPAASPTALPSAAPAAAARAAAVAVSAAASPAAAPASAAPALQAVLAAPAPAANPAAAPAAAALGERAAAVAGAQGPAAAPRASAEALSASASALFDGALTRVPVAGAEVSGRSGALLRSGGLTANAAAEESPASGEAAAPAPAPLLSGRVDASAYKVPLDIRLRRAAALGVHYALLAAVPALLVVGLGVLPALAGAAALGGLVAAARRGARANGAAELDEASLYETRRLLLKEKSGVPLTDDERARVAEGAAPFEQFLAWTEATVDYLTGRLGRDPQSAPRVWIDESSHDLHWAASVGGRLDKSGSIYMGVGFVLRPLERAVGVLAHEMGHLFAGDRGWLRERLRMHGGLNGGWRTGMTDASVVSIAAGLVHAGIAAFTAASPAVIVWGLAWAAAAMASAALALLAGLAATRQEELRADHFSAWLTDGSWLAGYLKDEAGRGRAERGRWRRWADHILSTHPAWETRVERLLKTAPGTPVDEAVLPVSDSFWGLSGESQAVVSGADAALADALARRAGGSYDVRVYQGVRGTLVVRAHPAQAARVDAAPDRAFGALLAATLAESYPAARIESLFSRVHPAVETLKGSPLGRSLLAELSEEPIALVWQAGGPGAARAALVLSGPRPTIVLNSDVYWKASPKAQAAALAHELFHYKAWRRFRAMGAPWLQSGGIEFERLAQGVGYRVFAELGGRASDDIELPGGRRLFEGGLARWSRSTPADEAEYLREHGYSSVLKLSDLKARTGAELAAELGEADADAVAAKVRSAWALHESESRAERLWRAAHPAAFLAARFLSR